MVGFPKHLNTKEDYIYVKENFPESQWRPCWESLIPDSKRAFFVGNLKDRASGVEDDTHYIVESREQDGDEVTYTQYEIKDDPSSDFFRLGFTKKEIEAALG